MNGLLRVMENLESNTTSEIHFPGLESHFDLGHAKSCKMKLIVLKHGSVYFYGR